MEKIEGELRSLTKRHRVITNTYDPETNTFKLVPQEEVAKNSPIPSIVKKAIQKY